jgi:glucose 1-dehydrogenase
MRLKNKNAVVTAAGSGICRAIAIGFAREGAQVVAGDIDLLSAQQTVELIKAAGGEALAVEVDVAYKDQVNALFAQAIAAYGRIHISVSGAGISTTRNFLDLPEDEWDRVIAVNLKGMYLIGQAAARHMAAHGGGAIINISSQCDQIAQQDYPHYIASKGGVKMLTKAMALDLVRHGIRVNALAPGLTLTASGGLQKEEYAHLRARVLSRIPMGRPAQPEEMIGAAIFLASDEEASYVTGISLPVDGGYLAY